LAFPIANRFCVALLYGRACRLTAENGGFRRGQVVQVDRRPRRHGGGSDGGGDIAVNANEQWCITSATLLGMSVAW
jgi:hypothetical protein